MPGESTSLPRHWLPRSADFLESLRWRISVSNEERENYTLAAQLGTFALDQVGLTRSTVELNLRDRQIVRISSKYNQTVRYLVGIANESEGQILQGQGVIDFLAATMVYTALEGGPAGMNDAFKFFEEEHMATVLERFPKLRGKEPRELFNVCLNGYFGAIPKYIVDRVSNIRVK